MPTPTQDNSPIAVLTPLGKDKLFLVSFSGREAISQLFSFQLEMIAANDTPVPFEGLLGKPVGVRIALPEDKTRFFQGIISRFAQGPRDPEFTHYRLEMVPPFWLLTRRVQSRIFQHMTVKTILQDHVLKGFDIDVNGIKGKLHERDFCVQYRESDFNFASRLMEEEGIYYFFKHTKDGCQMVLADTPQSHPLVPEITTAFYQPEIGALERPLTVSEWEKVQELRSGKYTLWDHHFELAHQHLETEKTILDSVAVGEVTHPLKVGDNDKLEIYDYPGAYAQRFDGIDKSGGEQPDKLQLIFEDNERTAAIRMQQEALPSLVIRGAGYCGQFTSGHKFTLVDHFNADGDYVLTGVNHQARISGEYRVEGGRIDFHYDNSFVCIPMDLPFRPLQVTPKPSIQGPQTAVVVGSPGQLMEPDKYGRVKVKFHWDRSPDKDLNASCWVRVSNQWGGAGWGGMFIPHVGQEVVVVFEEGDPDRPLIVGRVYNSECPPPLKLPDNKTKSALRDHGGNEIIMEGHDGVQQIAIYSPYAETTMHMGAAGSPPGWFTSTLDFITFYAGKDWTVDIDGSHSENIKLFQKESIGLFKQHTVGGFLHETVGGFKINEVAGFRAEIVGLYKKEIVGGRKNVKIGSKLTEKVIGNHTERCMANKETKASGHILVEALGDRLFLKCGGSSIELKNDGTITIEGNMIYMNAKNDIKGVAKADLILQGAAFNMIANTGDGKVQVKNLLKTESDMIVFDAKNDYKVIAKADLILQGASFVVRSSTGGGLVQAKSTLEIKGGPMVKINC